MIIRDYITIDSAGASCVLGAFRAICVTISRPFGGESALPVTCRARSGYDLVVPEHDVGGPPLPICVAMSRHRARMASLASRDGSFSWWNPITHESADLGATRTWRMEWDGHHGGRHCMRTWEPSLYVVVFARMPFSLHGVQCGERCFGVDLWVRRRCVGSIRREKCDAIRRIRQAPDRCSRCTQSLAHHHREKPVPCLPEHASADVLFVLHRELLRPPVAHVIFVVQEVGDLLVGCRCLPAFSMTANHSSIGLPVASVTAESVIANVAARPDARQPLSEAREQRRSERTAGSRAPSGPAA